MRPAEYPEPIARIHGLLLDRAVRDRRGPAADHLATRAMPFDFFVPAFNRFVEFDECQHFTEARALALERYPKGARLGFDSDEWSARCRKLKRKDRNPPHRDEQRAWLDTLRDLGPVLVGDTNGQPYRPTVRRYASSQIWCGEPVKALVRHLEDALTA